MNPPTSSQKTTVEHVEQELMKLIEMSELRRPYMVSHKRIALEALPCLHMQGCGLGRVVGWMAESGAAEHHHVSLRTVRQGRVSAGQGRVSAEPVCWQQ